MQLDARLAYPVNGFGPGGEPGIKPAIDGDLVVFVQPPVHPARHHTFNKYRP
ncbi:MAG: hypothetical protein RL748_578, partial [Pseudomonadota bacterium]